MAACLGLLACLAGCVTPSPGRPSSGFSNGKVGAAYLPLSSRDWLMIDHWGAGLVLAPGVAATNAHNANLLPADAILGRSRNYDLLFYRTDIAALPPTAQPFVGENVIAYGQGSDGSLREAKGVVRDLEELVEARCGNCPEQRTVAFDAEAGPGFSGGPLVDAKSGDVVGLVFGYRDGEGTDGGRRMFAYDIGLVEREWDRLKPQKIP